MTRQRRERVVRPDGRTWVYSSRGGRGVWREEAATGVALVVSRTHDLALARELVADRWASIHGRAPIPDGVPAWRRPTLDAFAAGRRTPHLHATPARGDEQTSYPVVVFAAPVSEEAA